MPDMKTLTIGNTTYLIVDKKAAQVVTPDNLYFDKETSMLYLMSNGEIVGDGVLVAAGGGGSGSGSGSGNNATMTLKNESGWIYKSISSGASCPIIFTWSSIEDDLSTGSGILRVLVNGTLKHTATIEQGTITVDVSSMLSTGSNTVTINVLDIYGNSKTIKLTVETVAISIASSFDNTIPYTGSFSYVYTPTGAVTKTVHFLVDGVEIATATVSTSGRQQTQTIPAQTHGSHTLEVYFTATIDSGEVESNHLFYDVVCLVDGNTTPIIASDFNSTTAEQFDSIVLTYRVYNPSSLTAAITLAANGATVNTLTVDRTVQTWTYRPDDFGALVLTITCGSVTKTFNLTITESQIDADAETDSLSLYLTSYGRSNSEDVPGQWVSGNVEAVFENFNFVSDGWVKDDDGITALRIGGDARLTIPLQIFKTDFRTTGKTIEIDFATRDILDYDAILLSCFSGNRGLQLSAQKALLKSEKSEISTQYKEDEHVRLSFVVQKRSDFRLLQVYINGVLSGVVQYDDEDDFSQSDPVSISVGSNECTIDLYTIRVYDNDLTRFQILDNWIADTQIASLKNERWRRNRVFDDYGQIVIDQLPSDLPYLVIQSATLPSYKGNKITVSGYYVDPSNSDNNFTFENCELDVQGTSSSTYARKNFKGKFKGGFTNSSDVASSTYQLREDSVPTSTFTFKADVASSEGANNVELVRLYNDICPYQTPPQVEDSSIRQGIDGFPIVIFQDDGDAVTFIGKYNFNNDKGTPEVYGFDDDDESWEISNNTSNRVLFKSADFSTSDWQKDFEARHPDGSTDATNLAALVEWIASTDTTAVSTEAEKTTRLQKFKDEFSDWLDLDSTLFYYLFTELFLMVDSRAKNAFPTRYDNGKWCWLPYDFDTAIGINNEGALVFGYELEDIDQTETGADVYNGQQSVLWTNVREVFQDELMDMYKTLRSDGKLSYADTEERFETHQSKWPEAIFNEDAYFKYLEPLFVDGTGAYLSMLQGSKAEQRKWWLYNRFRYMDSKYNAGDALTDIITLRGYEKSDITITPYADIYAAIKYGSYLVRARAKRGNSYTLECPLDNVNDTETYIYSASQLADVGDLSGYKVGYAEFSMATKLQSIKLGDANSSYSNTNLTELYLGNNVLLKTIDVRNCSNLGNGEKQQSVDISGCTNIEHIYFDGTAIKSLTLPNGGNIKTLHLPETITGLTIRNQNAITDFELPSPGTITTLRLENVSSAVDTYKILSEIPASSRVRLIGFNWTEDSAEDLDALADRLDTMRGLDENGNNVDTAQLSGTITVDTVYGSTLVRLQTTYPSVTVNYNKSVSKLTFCNYDGIVLSTMEVLNGGDGVYTGEVPTRPTTESAIYTFVGWSKSQDNILDDTALQNVVGDRTVYAVYGVTPIYYVRYYTHDGSTLLFTDKLVGIGFDSEYEGATPTRAETTTEMYTFAGWSLSVNGSVDAGALTNIVADRNVYAAYSITPIYYVYYYNDTTLLYTDKIYGSGKTSSYSGSTPTKVSTAQYAYSFDGWSTTNGGSASSSALTNVTANRSVYAAFTATVRTYTVYWYNGSVLISVTNDVAYGTKPTYYGSTPTYSGDDAEDYEFAGWSPAVAAITGNTTYTAVFVYTGYIYSKLIAKTLTSYSSSSPTTVGKYAFYYNTTITSVSLSNVTSLAASAFAGSSKLTTVDLPSVTSISGSGAFNGCKLLTSVTLPKVASMTGGSTFYACKALASIELPSLTQITASYDFYNCTSLQTVRLPSIQVINGGQVFYNCSALKALILSNPDAVCTLSKSTCFSGSGLSTNIGYIYVPSALVDSYKSATNWSTYASRFRALEDYTVDGTIDGELDASLI